MDNAKREVKMASCMTVVVLGNEEGDACRLALVELVAVALK
jgi:hypothetical protein